MAAVCKTAALMHAILEYTFVAIWGEGLFSSAARGTGRSQAGPGGSHDGGCLRPAV